MNRPDEREPVFSEPWHAQVFALAHTLNERGLFGWDEWAARFSRNLATQSDINANDDYYRAWLKTLEELVPDITGITSSDLSNRKQAWDKAARNTPHGQPIILSK